MSSQRLTTAHVEQDTKDTLFEIMIRLADDHLILGHRISEWCGHAPMLEEDLALPNIALDLIGQARNLYAYAAELENQGRDEDGLAYLRLERDYKNCLMVERPNTDFAVTMLRIFYFSNFMTAFWEAAQNLKDKRLQEIAGKAVKESRYHLRHASQWVIRLGDGTDESHERMVSAQSDLSPYLAELFHTDQTTQSAIVKGYWPDPEELRTLWSKTTSAVFAEATLKLEIDPPCILGGRNGIHTEDFGFLLAELQYMQRTFPNLKW